MDYSKIEKQDINKGALVSLCHKYMVNDPNDTCLVVVGSDLSLYVGNTSSLSQAEELKNEDLTMNQFVVQHKGNWTVSKVVPANLLLPVLNMFSEPELETADTHLLIQAGNGFEVKDAMLSTPPKSRNRLSHFALACALMAVTSTFLTHRSLANPQLESSAVSEHKQTIADFNNSIAELERVEALEAITISVTPET